MQPAAVGDADADAAQATVVCQGPGGVADGLPTHRQHLGQALLVAGQLGPSSEVGGDAFDDALAHSHVWLAIFDGMGHGHASDVIAEGLTV